MMQQALKRRIRTQGNWKRMPIFAWAVLLMMLVSHGEEAHAAWGDCYEAASKFNPPVQLRRYKINATYVSDFGLISAWAIGAVLLGSDTWNSQGNAGYFRWIAGSSLEDLPSSLATCDAQGIDYSLVTFNKDHCSESMATTYPRCKNSQNRATQFVIEFYAKGADCTNRSWGNGAISSSQADVASIMAHEFGHALNIGHPRGLNGDEKEPLERATMLGAQGARRRNIYEYDFKCSIEQGAYRNTSAYRRTQAANGTFGSATQLLAAVKATAGISHKGNPLQLAWAAAYQRGTGTSPVAFDLEADGSVVSIPTIGGRNGIGFGLGQWRETPTIDRIFYSEWYDDPVQYGTDSIHRVWQARSSNAFSSASHAVLKHCTTMNGFLSCSSGNRTAVTSPATLAMGWLGSTQRTVTAWLNHHRNPTNSKSNQIYISVGNVDDDTLPKPYETGIRSSVSPGLVCKENFSGSLDCIIAYVPIDNMTQVVFLRRFSVSLPSGASIYSVSMESHIQMVNVFTASRIALWYNQDGDKFYAAMQGLTHDQKLNIYSSADGTSWSLVQQNLDFAVMGPSISSAYTGTSPRLVYLK